MKPSTAVDRVPARSRAAAAGQVPVSLRLGLLVDLAPRKLGSFEDWILAMAGEASRRNHRLDVFGSEPIAPAIRRDLARLGSQWSTLEDLRSRPLAGIRFLRQYQVLHLNMLATRHPVSLMAYAAWPARIVFVDHTSEPPPYLGTMERWKCRVLDRLTLPRIARLVGVSEFVRRRARLELRLRSEKTSTIYNGIDLARFAPKRTPSDPPGFVVGCVANLIPAKGVEVLLRALAALNLPHWRLIVAGDGPDRERLEALSRELCIPTQVAFLGIRDDVPTLLRQCHVFVHPATWPEAFGLTITEALAAGCPVIASRVGAIPELIQDGENGLLVPPGDVEALAAALRMLYLDPRLAARLAGRARHRVEESFSLERCVGEHLDLMEELAGQERRALSRPEQRDSSVYLPLSPARVAKLQTQRAENPPGATPCEFDSRLGT